jgi:membrane protein DedA with SNARE-associated domain
MQVEQLVQQYGYSVVLVGTLFEGQPVMLFGGFAAHRGYLELVPWVILTGAVGNFLSYQVWFLVARRFGRPLIDRRPHWAGRIRKVQDWLERFESLLIITIRFMPGLDTIGTIAIGVSRVSVLRFTVLNALGALLWAFTLAVAGYLLGNLLELIFGDLEAVEKPLLIGIVVLTVVWIVYRHGKDHRPALRRDPHRAVRGPEYGAHGESGRDPHEIDDPPGRAVRDPAANPHHDQDGR